MFLSPCIYRYNKCCLDDVNKDGLTIRSVEEVRIFTKVTAPPIGNALVKSVSMGTSHSAIVTGKKDTTKNNIICRVVEQFVNLTYAYIQKVSVLKRKVPI